MQDNLLLIISLIVGLVGMPIIQKIKEIFQLADNKALLVALGVSVVFGALSVWGSGGFNLSEFTPDAVVSAIALVFGSASVFYKVLISNRK